MISAKELRLGNIVEQNGVEYVADFITIKMAHNYNPVPLTKEILLKCGFVTHDKEVYFLSSEEFEIQWDKYGMDINFRSATIATTLDHIKYLHHLQNLYYALTQKELEIKF